MAKTYFADVTAGWEDRITQQAVTALERATEAGEEGIRESIDASVTPWGLARVAGTAYGPKGSPTPRAHAGRRESDQMYNDVDSDVEQVDEKVWEGRMGWSNPEDYYLIQQWGYEKFDTNIVPMEALQQGLDRAEADLDGALRDIVRGGR